MTLVMSLIQALCLMHLCMPSISSGLCRNPRKNLEVIKFIFMNKNSNSRKFSFLLKFKVNGRFEYLKKKIIPTLNHSQFYFPHLPCPCELFFFLRKVVIIFELVIGHCWSFPTGILECRHMSLFYFWEVYTDFCHFFLYLLSKSNKDNVLNIYI